MDADIVIGANLGDEGKGSVVASLTKATDGEVLNVLTNGGSQRAHSILTEDGSFTFKHFGSGTYHGADSYYSRFFIINPMQFVKEYNELTERGISLKGKIFCDPRVRWSTPYDMMANQIIEHLRGENKHGSCGMGIWETVLRCHHSLTEDAVKFAVFVNMPLMDKLAYLTKVKKYYDKRIGSIPKEWLSIWNSPTLALHFIEDCQFMYDNITLMMQEEFSFRSEHYERVIFENGQGLMLNSTGKDIAGTTPSSTGCFESMAIAYSMGIKNSNVHYVTRPYMTRHGRGFLDKENKRDEISSGIQMDRTNHYNIFQEDFRYAPLDINELNNRITDDYKKCRLGKPKLIVDVTHCDEMDRVDEFKKHFINVNTYDDALIK